MGKLSISLLETSSTSNAHSSYLNQTYDEARSAISIYLGVQEKGKIIKALWERKDNSNNALSESASVARHILDICIDLPENKGIVKAYFANVLQEKIGDDHDMSMKYNALKNDDASVVNLFEYLLEQHEEINKPNYKEEIKQVLSANESVEIAPNLAYLNRAYEDYIGAAMGWNTPIINARKSKDRDGNKPSDIIRLAKDIIYACGESDNSALKYYFEGKGQHIANDRDLKNACRTIASDTIALTECADYIMQVRASNIS